MSANDYQGGSPSARNDYQGGGRFTPNDYQGGSRFTLSPFSSSTNPPTGTSGMSAEVRHLPDCPGPDVEEHLGRWGDVLETCRGCGRYAVLQAINPKTQDRASGLPPIPGCPEIQRGRRNSRALR